MTEGLDDFEIEAELLEIQSIHESFDTENPITYSLLLERCKERLNEAQKNYINNQIKRLKMKQIKISHKWLEKFSDPISRVPLLEKNKCE
jgi:hypothetical protein